MLESLIGRLDELMRDRKGVKWIHQGTDWVYDPAKVGKRNQASKSDPKLRTTIGLVFTR